MFRARVTSSGALFHRFVAKHLLLVLPSVFVAFAAEPVCAQNAADRVQGKALFQREWTHNSPKLPPRTVMSDASYIQLLKSLPGDGLGPMFNATSCEACHDRGGSSGVDRNVTMLIIDPRSPIIDSLLRSSTRQDADLRKQLGRKIDSLFPGFISPRGAVALDVVVHESSARGGYRAIRKQLTEGVPGGIDPEWFDRSKRTPQAIAERPVIAGRRGDIDFYLSQRNSPPLFGMGLIDSISMTRLSQIAASQNRRTSGQVTGRVGTGKFGWRAQTPSLDAFVRGACAGELGLQVPSTPQPPDLANLNYVSLGEDLNKKELAQLVSYVQSLPAPVNSRQIVDDDWTTARHGKRLFAKIGCVDCHVENVSPARGIYSDLLLHDMGDLLQAPSPASSGNLTGVPRLRVPFVPRDSIPIGSGSSIASYYSSASAPLPYALERPEEPVFPYGQVPKLYYETKNASRLRWDLLQREWRTPPLWGVADSGPYLHDGRATTLNAAIRWHGGEAQQSVMEYRSLIKADREALLSFLKSLRSPVDPKPNQSKPDRSDHWIDSVAVDVSATTKSETATSDTATPSTATSDTSNSDKDTNNAALDVFATGY
ncbi:MAG: hypothetical protein HKN47_07020 [Pirellulaceae bacterium]|nr:hypothetical protein [Pirellulaceae bacterium]